ncbi:hypothetical protein Syun_030159 [Stephania yunnanensis]|uniref:Uncharacterized protein n=1 Tax=Stephania yunnanensis TaxID=152371 RepID=A0AAP0HM24_9MAGN
MLFQWSGTLVSADSSAAAPSHIKAFSRSRLPVQEDGIEGIHFAEYVALSNGDCGAWSFDVTVTNAMCKWNVNFTCGVEMKGMVSGAWSGRGPNEGGGLSIPSKVNALLHLIAKLFLVVGFSQWQSRRWKALELGR